MSEESKVKVELDVKTKLAFATMLATAKHSIVGVVKTAPSIDEGYKTLLSFVEPIHQADAATAYVALQNALFEAMHTALENVMKEQGIEVSTLQLFADGEAALED